LKKIVLIRNLLTRAKEGLLKNYFKIIVILAIASIVSSSGVLSLLLSSDIFTLRIVSSTSQGGTFVSMMSTSLATVVAIFFSISILVIQHAASNYTASILEDYKKDGRTWFVYGFFFFSLIFSSFLLITEVNISPLNTGFVMLIFSFAFLASQFIHTVNMINPMKVIERAKDQSIRDIHATPSRVSSIVKKAKPRNEVERIMIQSPIYPQFVFYNDQTLLTTSRQKILQITDIVLKSSVRREIETCMAGFGALSEIARSYVSIRKDDMTQEDRFLQYIYDKVLSIPKIAFDNEDVSLLQEIIKAFEDVGCSTAEIKPISDDSGPNQATALAVWYIDELGVKAIDKSLWDVVSQAIRSIMNIGTAAIRKAGEDALASDKILNLGIRATKQGKWVVTNVASGALKELLLPSALARVSVHGDPSRIMKDIEKLSISAVEVGLGWQALTGLFPIMPEYSIQKVAWAALTIKNESYPKMETHRREEYTKDITSKLMETLEKIGMKAAENHSRMLMQHVVEAIEGIAILLVKEKFLTLKEGFDQELVGAIKALQDMHLLSREDSLSTTVRALTAVAFCSLDVRKDEMAIRSVNALLSASVKAIEWDKYGYESARLASKIAMIGSYALHLANEALAKECADRLVEFDSTYLKESPSTHDRLHIEEMQETRRQMRDETNYFDKTYGSSYREVSETTLDRFKELYETARQKEFKSYP